MMSRLSKNRLPKILIVTDPARSQLDKIQSWIHQSVHNKDNVPTVDLHDDVLLSHLSDIHKVANIDFRVTMGEMIGLPLIRETMHLYIPLERVLTRFVGRRGDKHATTMVISVLVPGAFSILESRFIDPEDYLTDEHARCCSLKLSQRKEIKDLGLIQWDSVVNVRGDGHKSADGEIETEGISDSDDEGYYGDEEGSDEEFGIDDQFDTDEE